MILALFAPKPEDVVETLKRVLASATFNRSERSRDLLRYLVEAEQAGKAGQLKGMAIAMDVFGKDAAHDPSTDAHVRVQAGRLRELLEQYFEDEGRNEPIRIVIPRGGYAPIYEQNRPSQQDAKSLPESTSPPPAVPAASSPPVTVQAATHLQSAPKAARGLLLAVGGVAALSVAAFLGYRTLTSSALPPAPTPAAETASPPVAAAGEELAATLPKVYLNVADSPAAQNAGVVLRSALPGFDTVTTVGREAPAHGDATPLDFVFNVMPGPEDGSVEISLQNVASSQVIFGRVLPTARMGQPALDDWISDLTSASLPVSGSIYAFLETNRLQRGLARCLLLTDDYFLDQREALHKVAYECFEQLKAEQSTSPLALSEMAALKLETVTDKYDYPPNATKEGALALARRAIQLAPTSAYAHRSYGFLFQNIGDKAGAVEWMRKAYALDRFDLSMAAALGYALIMNSEYAEGTTILTRAVRSSSSRPAWWDYCLFLGAVMQGEDGLAGEATSALLTSSRPHYLAARIMVADARSDANSRERLLKELREKYPGFASDARLWYENAGYPKDLTDKLVSALETAGLRKPG